MSTFYQHITTDDSVEASTADAEAAKTAALAAQSAAETASATATSSKNAAATSETNAAASSTSAGTYSTTSTQQAAIATTKASESAASAVAALASQNAAASSASASSSSETNASSSATNAAASATAAQNSKTDAEAAFDSFDSRYLGAKASDPVADNDGGNLTTGTLHYNSSNGAMKVYTGSAWAVAYVDSASGTTLLKANNLSDLVNATTARTNLGLGTAATTASTDYATAAQGTKADDVKTSVNNITDVNITSVADNEVLAYDNSSSKWINQTAAEAGLATTAQATNEDTVIALAIALG
tara:strand:+ start:3480 stop:4382 length:903 start_codon:yes stop_codon:yes gene_type:complete